MYRDPYISLVEMQRERDAGRLARSDTAQREFGQGLLNLNSLLQEQEDRRLKLQEAQRKAGLEANADMRSQEYLGLEKAGRERLSLRDKEEKEKERFAQDVAGRYERKDPLRGQEKSVLTPGVLPAAPVPGLPMTNLGLDKIMTPGLIEGSLKAFSDKTEEDVLAQVRALRMADEKASAQLASMEALSKQREASAEKAPQVRLQGSERQRLSELETNITSLDKVRRLIASGQVNMGTVQFGIDKLRRASRGLVDLNNLDATQPPKTAAEAEQRRVQRRNAATMHIEGLALLRQQSGATVTDGEWERFAETFPQIYDNPEDAVGMITNHMERFQLEHSNILKTVQNTFTPENLALPPVERMSTGSAPPAPSLAPSGPAKAIRLSPQDFETILDNLEAAGLTEERAYEIAKSLDSIKLRELLSGNTMEKVKMFLGQRGEAP